MITTYKGSDGKEELISEMNPFHLVNAYAKVVRLNHNADVSLAGEFDFKELETALRTEIMNRLSPPKAA